MEEVQAVLGHHIGLRQGDRVCSRSNGGGQQYLRAHKSLVGCIHGQRVCQQVDRLAWSGRCQRHIQQSLEVSSVRVDVSRDFCCVECGIG